MFARSARRQPRDWLRALAAASLIAVPVRVPSVAATPSPASRVSAPAANPELVDGNVESDEAGSLIWPAVNDPSISTLGRSLWLMYLPVNRAIGTAMRYQSRSMVPWGFGSGVTVHGSAVGGCMNDPWNAFHMSQSNT